MRRGIDRRAVGFEEVHGPARLLEHRQLDLEQLARDAARGDERELDDAEVGLVAGLPRHALEPVREHAERIAARPVVRREVAVAAREVRAQRVAVQPDGDLGHAPERTERAALAPRRRAEQRCDRGGLRGVVELLVAAQRRQQHAGAAQALAVAERLVAQQHDAAAVSGERRFHPEPARVPQHERHAGGLDRELADVALHRGQPRVGEEDRDVGLRVRLVAPRGHDQLREQAGVADARAPQLDAAQRVRFEVADAHRLRAHGVAADRRDDLDLRRGHRDVARRQFGWRTRDERERRLAERWQRDAEQTQRLPPRAIGPARAERLPAGRRVGHVQRRRAGTAARCERYDDRDALGARERREVLQHEHRAGRPLAVACSRRRLRRGRRRGSLRGFRLLGRQRELARNEQQCVRRGPVCSWR
jgi:hypothetical protein